MPLPRSAPRPTGREDAAVLGHGALQFLQTGRHLFPPQLFACASSSSRTTSIARVRTSRSLVNPLRPSLIQGLLTLANAALARSYPSCLWCLPQRRRRRRRHRRCPSPKLCLPLPSFAKNTVTPSSSNTAQHSPGVTPGMTRDLKQPIEKSGLYVTGLQFQ